MDVSHHRRPSRNQSSEQLSNGSRSIAARLSVERLSVRLCLCPKHLSMFHLLRSERLTQELIQPLCNRLKGHFRVTRLEGTKQFRAPVEGPKLGAWGRSPHRSRGKRCVVAFCVGTVLLHHFVVNTQQ